MIRSVRSGDESQIQERLSQGDNVNGLYHASDLRWCWIPVIGVIGLSYALCPILLANDQSTPLMTAVGDGNFKTARFLIEHGADVNLPAKYNQPHMGAVPVSICPLTAAIEAVDVQGPHMLVVNSHVSLEDSAKFAQFLIDHGAKVNGCSAAENRKGAFNLSPIFAAADVGNVAVAQTLLDHGADIEAKDAMWGGTPLMWAAWRGHAKMVQFLIEHQANVHAIAERSTDKTVLDWATCPSSPHNPEVIRLIALALRNNASSQVASSSSSGPIFKAARNGDDDQVRALIEKGADVNATDSYGFTPLMWAAYEGQTDTAEILLKAGAHLTMTNRDGDNALIIAADKGQLDMVKLLFKHGAPLNDRDEKGYTAIMWAKKRHHGNIVKFLKKHGTGLAHAHIPSSPKKKKTHSKPSESADVQSVLP